MPATASELGAEIRRQRKVLKVSATVAAEAAGLSRMTWHRIEKGELLVALGAWLAAARDEEKELIAGLKMALDREF